MFRNASEIDKIKNSVRLLTIFALLLSLAMWIDNMVTESWLENKNKVACHPVTDEIYPSVYDQAISNPLNNEINLHNFINDYVFYTETEKYADFHVVIGKDDPDAKRYDKARLSLHKQKALYMAALGSEEFKLRKQAFAYSNKRYKELESEGKNIIFHVDQIIPNPVPFSMITKIVVRGFYREYWDFKDKENRLKQNRILGRSEIVYYVMHDLPEVQKLKNKKLASTQNKYGLFVVDHDRFNLSKEEYNKRIIFHRKTRMKNKTSLENFKNLYYDKKDKEEEK